MNKQNNAHLHEEQILMAVIDEQELSREELQHLKECPSCTINFDRVRDELYEFGQKSRQAVPSFSRPVKLPSASPSAVNHNAGWIPFFGTVAMAGLVLFFYFMGLETVSPTKLSILQSQEYLLEDESLMREISDMVEYPLFEEMYELTGENGIGFDEDFLQFVVPEIQDDFQSELYIQGGMKRC